MSNWEKLTGRFTEVVANWRNQPPPIAEQKYFNPAPGAPLHKSFEIRVCPERRIALSPLGKEPELPRTLTQISRDLGLRSSKIDETDPAPQR